MESRSGSERVACLLANLFVEKLGYNVTILNRITEKNDVVYFLSESINVLAFKGNPLHFLKNVQNYVDENKPKAIVVHNMRKQQIFRAGDCYGHEGTIFLEYAVDVRTAWTY